MTANECITGRRSIRRFKADSVSHETLSAIVETAAYAPSWKNTQVTRYIAVETPELKNRVAAEATADFPHNAEIINNAPLLVVVTMIKGRSGYERDGSFSTSKGDRWQTFDAGIATECFCLAAYEQGLGTVIMGIFDEKKVVELLQIPDNQEVAALIAVGYADESPEAPKRKTVDELLSYQ